MMEALQRKMERRNKRSSRFARNYMIVKRCQYAKHREREIRSDACTNK